MPKPKAVTPGAFFRTTAVVVIETTPHCCSHPPASPRKLRTRRLLASVASAKPAIKCAIVASIVVVSVVTVVSAKRFGELLPAEPDRVETTTDMVFPPTIYCVMNCAVALAAIQGGYYMKGCDCFCNANLRESQELFSIIIFYFYWTGIFRVDDGHVKILAFCAFYLDFKAKEGFVLERDSLQPIKEAVALHATPFD